MKVTYKAAAKINLMLDIISRLDNGYHSLFMIMQSVGLYDTVTAERSGTDIEITCDNQAIPCNESNTAFKAAKLFKFGNIHNLLYFVSLGGRNS